MSPLEESLGISIDDKTTIKYIVSIIPQVADVPNDEGDPAFTW